MQKNLLVATGMAGLLSVPIYVATVAGLGSRVDGYDHARQYVSELGATGAPDAVLFNAILVLLGFAMFVVAAGYNHALRNRPWRRITTFFIGLFGVGIVAGGLFPCDPGCAGQTLSAKLHGLLGLPTMFSTFVAPFLLAHSLRGDHGWPRRYRAIVLTAGATALPVFLSSLPVPQTLGFIGYFHAVGLTGIGQRFFALFQLTWVVILCVGLLVRARHAKPTAVDVVAHKSLWRTSDAIALLATVAAAVLQVVAPVQVLPASQSPILWIAGTALFVAGLHALGRARREQSNRGQRTGPACETTNLVTTGPYATHRNPMYRAVLVMLLGVGVSGLLPWLIVLLPAVTLWMHITLIEPEERYLSHKFGERYASYVTRTSRW